MKRLARLLTLVMTLAALGAPGLMPTAHAAKRITGFEAVPGKGAMKKIAPGDFKAMLGVCDARLDACKKDSVGVPYLAAAYLALWAILIVFLILVRRGQARLRGELDELRARLGELE